MNTNYLKEFKFSKKKVEKATKLLINNNISLEQKLESYQVLANFRSSHFYPMQLMIRHFRKKSLELDKKAIIVHRLKRIPSILSKLKREPTMSVRTMGDIGGIRVILDNIVKVEKLRDNLKKSRTKNKLISERDYLNNPKDSGYRSIHLTYSYQGAKENYRGFRIELQIRSKIQHYWATAVEVVGTFAQENLKASEGNQDWLEFFQLISCGFSHLEKSEKIDSQLKKAIKNKSEQLQVEVKMKAFSITTKHSKESEGYFLLRLDITNQKLTVQNIQENQFEEVYEDYRRIEQEFAEDNTKDVVLVAAKSIHELKKAYPNYFADTEYFLKNLSKVLN